MQKRYFKKDNVSVNVNRHLCVYKCGCAQCSCAYRNCAVNEELKALVIIFLSAVAAVRMTELNDSWTPLGSKALHCFWCIRFVHYLTDNKATCFLHSNALLCSCEKRAPLSDYKTSALHGTMSAPRWLFPAGRHIFIAKFRQPCILFFF